MTTGGVGGWGGAKPDQEVTDTPVLTDGVDRSETQCFIDDVMSQPERITHHSSNHIQEAMDYIGAVL